VHTDLVDTRLFLPARFFYFCRLPPTQFVTAPTVLCCSKKYSAQTVFPFKWRQLVPVLLFSLFSPFFLDPVVTFQCSRRPSVGVRGRSLLFLCCAFFVSPRAFGGTRRLPNRNVKGLFGPAPSTVFSLRFSRIQSEGGAFAPAGC